MNRFLRALQAWQDSSANPAQRLPTALQFPVNDICNSNCQMCHIWKRKRDYEMSPNEVRIVLSDPLFREVQNVGINGGEPTLRADLEDLVAVIVETLPKLESVALITNALRASRVINAVESIGRRCKDAGKHLDVMVSLDGIGDVHDRVRGVPGNFASANVVIDYLLSTPWVASCRLGCTIIAENAFGVEDVLEFANRKGIYVRFRLGVPHPRLYTETLREPFALSPEAQFHVAAFLETLIYDYERDPVRRAFYQSLRDQLVYGRPRAAGCTWKNHGVTLGPRGELAFCAVASPTIGNAREVSAEKVFWENSEVLSTILQTKCADCRHDYDGIGSRRVLIRQWLSRASKKVPMAGRRFVLAGVDRMRKAGEWAEILYHGKSKRNKPRQPVRDSVLLCGWYGTETLGDRAILAGLCRLLAEEMPGVAVDVASLEPYVTKETCRIMPELKIRAVIDLPEAMTRTAMGTYGVIAVAGGPLMTPVREVIDLAKLLEVARHSGALTTLLGCGLGPLVARGARRFAVEKMVKEAGLCIFRDRSSAELARAFGRNGVTKASVDPAFLWTALRQYGERKSAGRTTIALALRDWQIDAYAADLPRSAAQELKTRFEIELLRLVDALRESGGVEILPICMHTLTVGGDDRMFYRRLFEDRPDLAASIPWRRRSPQDELEQMRCAEAVVAMRYHACVFALAMQKPFVALDYTRGGKIAGLMSDTENHDRMIDLARFDGRQAAMRLLVDIEMRKRPNPPAIAEGERIYREGLRWLAKGISSASNDFVRTAEK